MRRGDYLRCMSEFDAHALQRDSFVNTVVLLPEIDSTNDYAKRMVGSQAVELPALIVAQQQTAGRGQQEKSWWSGSGSLTFTLVLEQSRCAPGGITALASAIAVCQTIGHFHPSLQPNIKWPNDVFLANKKTAGILIENIADVQNFMLVGIGVNTNCQLQRSPEHVRSIATSLFDESGKTVPQQQFLLHLTQRLNLWICDREPKGIIDTFMRIARFKKGETILVESSRFGALAGQFLGIGSLGELILSVNGKSFSVESGSIATEHSTD